MNTNFLPVLAFLLATMLMPPTNRASSPPLQDQEGDALETAPAASLDSAKLQPGAALIAGRNVNIRAKATINSEVVTQLQDGDAVFVEEVILRPDAKGKDPTRWAQIAYPATAAAWVHSLYIDGTSGTVKPKTLNVRSGPGENYTVIGTIGSGDKVESLETKGAWLQIQPPQGTTAYVAAKLLRQKTTPDAGPATEVASTETEVVETAVVESQTEIVAGSETGDPEMVAVTETAEVEETEVIAGATTVTDTNTLAADMGLEALPLPEIAPEMEEVPDEPLPPRVVQREGIVRTFTSIQAPSDYKLVSTDNGRTINYLHTTSTNLDLGRYVGYHIIATGEEALDRRWPNMPVLTLKRIVLVE